MASKATTRLPDYPKKTIIFSSDSIQLGAGVHAITGDKAKSALKPHNRGNVDVETSNDPGSYHLQADLTADDLSQSHQNFASGSVIVPLPAGNSVGLAGGYGIGSQVENEVYSRFIRLHWEQFSSKQTLATRDVKLSDEAVEVATNQPSRFREIYGDYFVTGVRNKREFTALWKYTSATHSDMASFQASISAAANAPIVPTGQNVPFADVNTAPAGGTSAGASLSFFNKLLEAAQSFRMRLDIFYKYSGDMKNTKYDPNDVEKAFEAFRQHASPVPYEATLQHYATIEQRVPRDIPMSQEHFLDLLKVFSLVQRIQTSLDIPHGIPAIEKKRPFTQDLIMELSLQWPSYEDDPAKFKHMNQRLKALDKELSLCRHRHELVMETRSYQYTDFIETVGSAVHKQGRKGVWVKTTSKRKHAVGRAAFSEDDLKQYGLVRKESKVPDAPNSITSWPKSLLDIFKVCGRTESLSFPFADNEGRHYVVGFSVEDCANTGKTGRFFIDSGLKLGIEPHRMVPILVRNKLTHMNWKMLAYYIPSSVYDDPFAELPQDLEDE